MARVLAISSLVADGHVGLSAIVPALQRLGHGVITLPTVVLSNHLGHARAAGMTVPAEKLTEMLEALDANGRLSAVDAVLTGYLPSAAHVRFAAGALARVRLRRPGALGFCDPVLGDDPKGLYLDRRAALALRDELLPRADFATPNRFELAWLSDRRVGTVEAAVEAARRLKVPATLATSIPAGGDQMANILVMRGSAIRCTVARIASVPHGTGDFMAALFAGHCLKGGNLADHLGAAAAGVAAAIATSAGAGELDLAAAPEAWSNPRPLAVDPL